MKRACATGRRARRRGRAGEVRCRSRLGAGVALPEGAHFRSVAALGHHAPLPGAVLRPVVEDGAARRVAHSLNRVQDPSSWARNATARMVPTAPRTPPTDGTSPSTPKRGAKPTWVAAASRGRSPPGRVPRPCSRRPSIEAPRARQLPRRDRRPMPARRHRAGRRRPATSESSRRSAGTIPRSPACGRAGTRTVGPSVEVAGGGRRVVDLHVRYAFHERKDTPRNREIPLDWLPRNPISCL